MASVTQWTWLWAGDGEGQGSLVCYSPQIPKNHIWLSDWTTATYSLKGSIYALSNFPCLSDFALSHISSVIFPVLETCEGPSLSHTTRLSVGWKQFLLLYWVSLLSPGLGFLLSCSQSSYLCLMILFTSHPRKKYSSRILSLKQNNNNTIWSLDIELTSNLYSISLVPFIDECFDNIAPTSLKCTFYSSVLHRLDLASYIYVYIVIYSHI